MESLIFLALMFGIFYLLLIRPQQKRARDQRQLLASLSTGDRVVTIGGVHGTIRSLDDDTARIEVADGTIMTFSRGAVARRLVDVDAADIGDTGDTGEATS